jgi:hypothetical protein
VSTPNGRAKKKRKTDAVRTSVVHSIDNPNQTTSAASGHARSPSSRRGGSRQILHASTTTAAAITT